MTQYLNKKQLDEIRENLSLNQDEVSDMAHKLYNNAKKTMETIIETENRYENLPPLGITKAHSIKTMTKVRGFEKISFDQWMKDKPSDVVNGQWMELYNDLKLPKRATKHSAGSDVFSPFEFTIEPMEDIKIPTGFKAYMLCDEKLMGHIRSSMGFKYYLGLANVTMVGDSDFYNNPKDEGHYWIKIRNNGTQSVTIKKGEAFAQVMFEKYLLADGDSFEEGEDRTGGIGSTTK